MNTMTNEELFNYYNNKIADYIELLTIFQQVNPSLLPEIEKTKTELLRRFEEGQKAIEALGNIKLFLDGILIFPQKDLELVMASLKIVIDKIIEFQDYQATKMT